MVTYGRSKGLFGMVRYTKFPGGTRYNMGNLSIMDVTYMGQKMMLDLEVQATDHPGKQPASGGIIACRGELVYGPVIGDNAVFVRQGEFRTGHHMSGLEYYADAQSRDEMHAEKSQDDDPRGKRYHDQWEYQCIGIIKQLPGNKLYQFISVFVFPAEEAFVLVPPQADKILGRYPGNGGKAIEKPYIHMLKPVEPIFFRMR